MKEKIPIIIDTDPGLDDALALMLAVKSDLFDIKAITTVAGNSIIEDTTRNAKYMLELLNRKDIPVYSGAEKPLNAQFTPTQFHGEGGLGGVAPKFKPVMTNNAVDKIIEILKQDKEKEITIVAIGPLTNIAKAIIKDAKAMKRAKQILIMGGTLNGHGNMNRVAEFNIYVDPDAANIVFDFPVDKLLVPLEACDPIQLSLEYFEKLKGSSNYDLIIKMMTVLVANSYNETGLNSTVLYDPNTLYYLINPSAFTFKDYDLHVETKGELTRGMTVPELRSKYKKPNIKVAEKINAEAFKKDFLNILKN